MGLAELLAVAGAAGVVLLFKASARAKYPHRLRELQTALQNRAELLLYRNRDEDSATEYRRLADHLISAQALTNTADSAARSEWRRLRPSLIHMTSEEVLTKVDLFYTDRREDIKAAVWDLVTRLDKKVEG